MQPNSNPQTIEELKAAGEELKRASSLKSGQKEEKLPSVERKRKESLKATPSSASTTPAPAIIDNKTTESKQGIDLLRKIGEGQKKVSQELSVLEKTYQGVKELENKLEERIELLKRLQDKSTEISKELKEFEEQLTLAETENKGLLNQIKNKLQIKNE